MHGADATKMKTLSELRLKKFHRIIYNFPHAGFYGREDNPDMIMMHKDLVRGFLRNAGSMLWLDGEIHISHKITPPFDSWKIKDLALECSLLCIVQDEFKTEDYLWYRNKRGSGSRSDDPFPLGPCTTFKFKLSSGAAENLKKKRKLDLMPPTPEMFPPPPFGMQQRTPVSPLTFPTPSFGMRQQPTASPLAFYDANSSINGQELHKYRSECHGIFGAYLKHVEETFGSSSYDVRRSVEEALRLGFEMYMGAAAPGRPLSDFIGILEELHHLSILRSKRLMRLMQLHLDRQL